MTKPLPSIERLNQMLLLREDGVLVRKIDAGNKGKAGAVVGTRGQTGHLSATLDGRTCFVHRVVFAMAFGRWPDGHIDHINGDPTDNRPSNLREVSHAENCLNRKPGKPSNTGIPGVQQINRRFRASIKKDGSLYQLGVFDSLEEARAARMAGEVCLFKNHKMSQSRG